MRGSRTADKIRSHQQTDTLMNNDVLPAQDAGIEKILSTVQAALRCIDEGNNERAGHLLFQILREHNRAPGPDR